MSEMTELKNLVAVAGEAGALPTRPHGGVASTSAAPEEQ